MKYRHIFTVQGRGHFPDDMLRYDSCVAHSFADLAAMPFDGIGLEVRSITLVHETTRAVWEPTHGRWQSFLWSVDPRSIKREKLS